MQIAYEHMERWSVLPEVQEMQNKTVSGLHVLPIRQVWWYSGVYVDIRKPAFLFSDGVYELI